MDTTESTALLNQVRRNLEELNHQLFIAQAGVLVATQALKSQDAEQDFDIACVLEHLVGDRLSTQLQRTEALLDALDPRRSPDPPVLDPDESQRIPLQ